MSAIKIESCRYVFLECRYRFVKSAQTNNSSLKINLPVKVSQSTTLQKVSIFQKTWYQNSVSCEAVISLFLFFLLDLGPNNQDVVLVSTIFWSSVRLGFQFPGPCFLIFFIFPNSPEYKFLSIGKVSSTSKQDLFL